MASDESTVGGRQYHAISDQSRAEEGCIRYEYSFGIAEDELLLTEVWRDAEAIEVHKNSDHFAKLGELKAAVYISEEDSAELDQCRKVYP